MHLELSSVMLWLRVTARISAIFLAGAFAAPALRLLWPSPLTTWMAASRHRFTLLFALSHTFHLAGVLTLASLMPAQFFSKKVLLVQIPGGVGYVLIYYLAWMAFARRKNPELRDTKMQTFSLYIAWAVFALAFTAGMRRDALIYAPLAAMMLLALGVRIFARFSVAPRHSSAPA
jgi:methionine sulfoxide reductase heme-binding subunit